MSTRPLESWAGLRRTCTVVQISRGSSRRQILVRITIGGQAHGEPEATCAKKLTCSPTGRASILKKGLVSHDFPSLKESCLIWWMTVRQSWRPATGTSCGQSPAILKEKRYHTSSPNFTSSPAPVARSDLTWISARSLGTRPPGSKPIALLHGHAAHGLADGVLDDADAQRLQLAVELTSDPPPPQQLRRRGPRVREELGQDVLGCTLRR